ncbi:MAG: winged helix-turn-helix domain-containing protein [Thermomicrobiales bacterium]|nr:winged helix-turn-helix domain-containing protein [Thermomicrobiales bacterium]
MLQLLASHPHRVFDRNELVDRLRGGHGDLHTVAVHVGRIQEKIEDNPADPRLIITVRGPGYRFDGPR